MQGVWRWWTCFRVGACLDTEMIRVLGAMRGGMGFGGGGVKEMQVHTGDEKTTKRWEADAAH